MMIQSRSAWLFMGVGVLAGSVWLAWPGQAEEPTDDGAPLVAACKQALEHCDADAFLKLIYTTDAPESQDLSSQRMVFEGDCHRAIDAITIQPLGADAVTSYELQGVRYRPTLPPKGILEIGFASEPGSAVHDEKTTFLVGWTKGRWWILTAEPDR